MNVRKSNLRILNLAVVAFAALISAAILLGASCGPDIPEIDVEADFITVGFEDHSTIELNKGSPEFTEINDEAIRIYQNICDTMECVLGPENVEEIESDNKFVEIEFIEPPSVTTYTDEGDVYKIFDSPSVIFVFTGEYAGLVLCAPALPTEWPEWGILGSRRSLDKLEKMADALHS